jgi:hypothetical protein
MSQQQSPPSLEQYPGYFPAAKPPFWTRTKVGSAAAAIGLFVGLVAGASNGSEATAGEPPPAAAPPATDIQAKIDAAVANAEDRLNDKISAVRNNGEERLAAARERAVGAQRRAVAQAVSKVRQADQAKLRQAVAAAKSQAQASTPPATNSPSAGSGTDPRFNYCYEANAAGYGPYFRGQDAEYYWYDDADNDGSVCE